MDFVLVHGAYHGAWCWDLLVPELQRRGHKTVTVDLPITDPAAGAAVYARTVGEAMSEFEAPLVLGHSMGGLVVPLIAATRLVQRMIFLAALLPEPGSSLADQRRREPIDPEPGPTTPQFTELGDGVFRIGTSTATEMFLSDAPKMLSDWAVERLRPQGYLFMDEVTPLASWPDTPSAYIVCGDDRAVNPAWCRRAAVERLGVEPHEIPGGHSPFLTRPTELADLLDAIATSR